MLKNIILIPIVTVLLCLQSCEEAGTADATDAVTDDVSTNTNPGDTILSGNVPTDVPFAGLTDNDINNRPAFDEFSWQMFVALCWPVDSLKRGVPLDPNNPQEFLSMSNSTPVVWTSYKNQWDLFDQGANVPSGWNDPLAPSKCGTTGVNHVFNTSKNVTVVGEADESFSVPLIDQNKNYTLFELRYNKPQYEFIADNGLYNSTKLMKYQMNHGDTLAMPSSTDDKEGSILVKAAWKQLTKGDPNNKRYYVISQMVFDPVSESCVEMTLGLVGLHMAQKTKNFPEWIWSSFEQVDNVPGAAGCKEPYSYNDGKGTYSAETDVHGFANKPGPKLIQDKSKRVPVQVTRLNEIPATPSGNSTVDINKKYQGIVKGTWMENYQLVITQWPSNPGSFTQYTQNGFYPGQAGGAFPVNDCVNTTMETYFQNQSDAVGAGGNSCMGCHYKAPNVDFSWSVFLRSHN